MLRFRDIIKIFELEGDLLKIIINKNYFFDLANISDKKILFDFAKEVRLDVKATGNKSTPDRTLIKILQLPANMASGILTCFKSSDPIDLCDMFK